METAYTENVTKAALRYLSEEEIARAERRAESAADVRHVSRNVTIPAEYAKELKDKGVVLVPDHQVDDATFRVMADEHPGIDKADYSCEGSGTPVTAEGDCAECHEMFCQDCGKPAERFYKDVDRTMCGACRMLLLSNAEHGAANQAEDRYEAAQDTQAA